MKLPRNVSGAEAVAALNRLGFAIARQVGSHVRLSNGRRAVTVPMHSTISVGTLLNIIRQAGITRDEFTRSL